MWNIIVRLDVAHGRQTVNDPRYVTICKIHRTIMYVATDRLRSQYYRTLDDTKLGSITHNHRVIDNSKDRQLYLLYKEGVVFQEVTRYPELIERWEEE